MFRSDFTSKNAPGASLNFPAFLPAATQPEKWSNPLSGFGLASSPRALKPSPWKLQLFSQPPITSLGFETKRKFAEKGRLLHGVFLPEVRKWF
jgi:hypothetical protein